MRNLWLSVITGFVFFVAGAAAQSTPSTQDQSQGTTGSSPAASAPYGAQGQSQSPEGTNSPNTMNSTAGQNTGYGQSGNTQAANGEKKMKGCVKSEGGQYMLETKNGKSIPLTGKDVSEHVGHEVMLHGTWAKSGDMSGMSGGSMGKGEHAFEVTSIDHLSSTCSGKSSKGSSAAAPPQ